jgi:hypothetical protein
MSKAYEHLKPFFDLLSSPDRLSMMLVLTGADVMAREYGIISHPLKGTVKLDNEGKDIYLRMVDDEKSIDLSKLEGHYKVLETKTNKK